MNGILFSFVLTIIGVSVFALLFKVYMKFFISRISVRPHLKLEEILRGESVTYTPRQLKKLRNFTIKSKFLHDDQRDMLISKIDELSRITVMKIESR